MLLHQHLSLGLELGDLLVNVLDLLLDGVVVLLQHFLGFFKVRGRRRRSAQGLVGGLEPSPEVTTAGSACGTAVLAERDGGVELATDLPG